MKKRIFVAINISRYFKDKIARLREKYKNLPVRWMVGDNLHLTLIPPLDLSDNEVVKMIKKLKKIEGEFGPIEIEFDKVCLGPDLRRPRLIWVKGEENFKLESLKNTLTDILGLREGGRPYFAHLTIARFKPNDYSNFPILDLSERIDWVETAESFNIIQSECLPEGARYTVLERIGL